LLKANLGKTACVSDPLTQTVDAVGAAIGSRTPAVSRKDGNNP
jgi:hypothetical protein